MMARNAVARRWFHQLETQSAAGPQLQAQLEWFNRLIDQRRRITGKTLPAVLAGDYNVVSTDFDIYATRSFRDNVLLQPALPRGLPEVVGSRLDGRAEELIRTIRCHVLELSAEPLAPGCASGWTTSSLARRSCRV